MQEWRGDLLVVPSTATPPAAARRVPEILSRAEIARRRLADSVSPAPVVTAPTVEMHVADVTPIPKNKGGRPRIHPL